MELDDIEIYKDAVLIERIGSEAVKQAQEENTRLGLPNVYSKRDKLYYQLPNGKITMEQPEYFSEGIKEDRKG